MDGLRVYRTALVASWHALLDHWPGADVIEGDGWFASRCPDPVFSNGVLEHPDVLAAVVSHFRTQPAWALWTWAEDTAGTARAAGLVRDETTVPMVLRLAGWRPPVAVPEGMERAADPAVVAALNALPPQTLTRAAPATAYLTHDHSSGLMVLGEGDHRNLSLVVTRPDRRRRGLATGLLAAALEELREAGVRTASLQATPAGVGVYAVLGFEPVGLIQEWVTGERG